MRVQCTASMKVIVKDNHAKSSLLRPLATSFLFLTKIGAMLMCWFL